MNTNTVVLPAGQILTVTADANSAGTVRRLGDPGAGTQYPIVSLAASDVVALGPFLENRVYEILSSVPGDALDAAVTAALTSVITPPIVELSADGAVPIGNGIFVITKPGVAALTLAAPRADQQCVIMHFTSRDAHAHTLTATGLIEDGVTGGPKNAATFAAFKGASISLVAINLKWHVLSLNAVTVAA
jgi:hypothetical protein